MRPNHEISPQLLDNRHLFKDPFYTKLKLRHDKSPLQLNERVSKNYLFPTLYGDVTCALAIFFCSYQKAKELLPHPDMNPVPMGKGRALVAISCYEYKQVLGVTPYNELAMTIPIRLGKVRNIPVLPMVLPWFKNFGYYCFSMPVTSLENQIRGQKIWGLPKIVQEINFEHTVNNCHVEVKDERGLSYLDLNIAKFGRPSQFDVKTYLYNVNNQKLEKAQTHFNGRFEVNKFIKHLWAEPSPETRSILKLGTSSASDVLRKLQIDPRPFQTRYTPSMSSLFDLPVDA